MTDVVAAEWLKTQTARWARYILAVMVLFVGLMGLLAWFFIATWDRQSSDVQAHSSLGSLTDLTAWIASVCMAIFGMLSITSEYSSGMIRTTFIAVPQRLAVLAAKALVVSVLTFVITEAALASTEFLTAFIVGGRHIVGQNPPSANDLVPSLAIGLSTVTFALIGLGLGAVTRSVIAGTVSLAFLWYIVPLLATHAPAPWSQWLTSLVPGALAGELSGAGNANSVFGAALPPWLALVVMSTYVSVSLGSAGIALNRRDA